MKKILLLSFLLISSLAYSENYLTLKTGISFNRIGKSEDSYYDSQSSDYVFGLEFFQNITKSFTLGLGADY